jgi:hypothetical protein
MNEELTLKEKALEAISKYLEATGWKWVDLNIGCETAWFQWIDPLTGSSHRSDFAFVIQTDRELSKKLFDTSS